MHCLCLHRPPQLVHDVCRSMIHRINFLPIGEGTVNYTKHSFSNGKLQRQKRVGRRERKWRQDRIQKPLQILSIKAAFHAINIFSVRVPQRRPNVTGALSAARIQTTTYSPQLWWAVQMRTTATWTIAAKPQITTQASNQLSPLSSRWDIKITDIHFVRLLCVCKKL
jgi:hypothetical protein